MSDKRPVRVFFKDQARMEYEELNRIVDGQARKGETNSDEMRLLKSIKQKIEIIKMRPDYGDNVGKEKIPKGLDVSNLYRLELTGYWRMMYSLEGNQIEIIAFILYIVDHPTYDKLFGYRKR